MAVQAYPFKRIFQRFFPEKYVNFPKDSLIPDSLDQRKELAMERLIQGELFLLQGNLKALSFFESATSLDPDNAEIWYRQGMAFFEYGSEEGQEKSLLLAGKYFKVTTELEPQHLHGYIAWGNTLLQLGRFYEEHHFFQEAKEKYLQAFSFQEQLSEDVLTELYWDYGICLLELAEYSGEALDLSSALHAFSTAEKLQNYLPPEFFYDFGNAYLEMGLLVNDSRFYFKAIEQFEKTVSQDYQFSDGWHSLAESYSQLYINTLDERYYQKASDAYRSALHIDPKNHLLWLGWAQVLSESGIINQNIRTLRQSVEACTKAAAIEKKDPEILAQWVESLSSLGALSGRLDLLLEAEHLIIKATDRFPDDPDLWRSYGICLACMARYFQDAEYYELSIEKLQWGLSLDRTHAELWQTLGQVHREYGQLNNDLELLTRASRFFVKAIEFKSSCPGLTFEKARIELELSEETGDLFSLQNAIEGIELILKQHGSSVTYRPEWLFTYASCLDWLAHFTSEATHAMHALDVFSQVLLLNPDYPDLYNRIAICHMELGHFTEEAYHYKQGAHFFQLALRIDEENDQIWLDWGLCLIHLADYTFDSNEMEIIYRDAEEKIVRAGQLGNTNAYYHRACLYSILGLTKESMLWMHRALHAHALPSLEEIAEDDWLDNVRNTPSFHQFFSSLETRLSQIRED